MGLNLFHSWSHLTTIYSFVRLTRLLHCAGHSHPHHSDIILPLIAFDGLHRCALIQSWLCLLSRAFFSYTITPSPFLSLAGMDDMTRIELHPFFILRHSSLALPSCIGFI